MTDVKTTKYVGYKGYIAGLVAIVLIGIIIAGMVLTSFGRAMTFAALNVSTVNKVADMQADYNAKFEISPKGE